MTGLRDEIDAFTAAAGWVAGKVDALPDSAWDAPGLGDWDMRALVGHTSRALLTVEQYLAAAAETEEVGSAEGYYEAVARMPGADPAAVRRRGIDAGAALGDDPASAFRAAAERVTALVRTYDDITCSDITHGDVLIGTIAGGIRLSSYLPTRTFELVVHGLDLSSAAGLPADPPDVALRRSLGLASSLAVRAGDGPALLVTLTGRASLPGGYSVLS